MGRIWTGIGASVCLLIVILDTKTALTGALEGLELSIKVVVPSLFPFFILSVLISRSFTGVRIPALKVINRLCAIPQGGESIYLLGFVGGYPVGAKSIENAYRDGCLDASDARRMLGFCNNAGPAFIFGMTGCLFTSKAPLWALWTIHILSSLLVGCLLPKHNTGVCKQKNNVSVSVPEAVEGSIKTMSLVCGWVIVFRVLITFLRRWFLWLFSAGTEAALLGFLELTNGCVCLNAVASPGLRFILCGSFLSFGGLCVAMQTMSVTKTLGTGMYFPGKILQTVFSFLLTAITQFFLFEDKDVFIVPTPLFLVSLTMICLEIIILYRSKKVVAIPI